MVHGFAFIVEQKAYATVNAKYQLSESFRGAYDLCMLQCAHFLRKWADRHGHPVGEIKLVIEQRPKEIGRLTDLMTKYGFWAPIHEKKQLEPLQCCDLIAWQFNNAMRQAYAGGLRRLEPALKDIAKIAGDYHIQQSQKQFETNCTQIGIPRRPGKLAQPRISVGLCCRAYLG